MNNEKMKRLNHESRQSSAASRQAKGNPGKKDELTSRAIIGQYSGLGPHAGFPANANSVVSDAIASKMVQSRWSAVESLQHGTGRAFGG